MSTYSIYCSDSPSPMSFDSMGAAIMAACGVITSGKTVLRIKG